jgi:putative ABC transport system permease protein
LVNIRTDQIASLQRFLADHGLAAPKLYPMVRARLTAVNGKPVSADDYIDERARRLINREFNLSWTDTLQTDNRIVEGRWFGNNDHGKALISVEQGIAETLGMSVGDVLSYDVAGAELEVKIASLREVQWDSFRVNFFVLAPPGVLESYPASWVTSFHLPREKGATLDTLVREFSNLIVIDVEAVLGQIVRMMDQVVRAVEFVFAFSLAAGVLVLLAAIASTHDERRLDAAVMRTLGATSRQLRILQITEFVFIGALAGLFAALGATLVGWVLAHNVLNVPYQISSTVWIIGLIAGAATVTAAGMAGTYRLIRTAPMEVFRSVV